VEPESLVASLRGVVAQLDVELPLAGVMSMPAAIERQHGGNPFFLDTLASFAILSLLLSAIGIYGLIAYSVGQRRQEIGIRMAVGANRYDVVRMILREGLVMAAIGGGIGFAMALPLPWVFEAMFATFRFREPVLYATVPAAILLVTIAAAYLPARRAASADPMLALRAE
jgi:ABC-type antimicrobial peptide transport system permease subunit